MGAAKLTIEEVRELCKRPNYGYLPKSVCEQILADELNEQQANTVSGEISEQKASILDQIAGKSNAIISVMVAITAVIIVVIVIRKK